MKVILYKKDKSFLSRLVSMVTRSNYTHSALLVQKDGQCYFSDSSLNKGITIVPLHKIPEYLKDREFEIYQICGTTKQGDLEALQKMEDLVGLSYDIQGASLWLLYRALKAVGIRLKNKKMYCFEYTLEVLNCYYTIEEKLTYAPSGDTIKDLMGMYSIGTRFINCNKAV